MQAVTGVTSVGRTYDIGEDVDVVRVHIYVPDTYIYILADVLERWEGLSLPPFDAMQFTTITGDHS